jgi:acetyl-CoA C-acetyltransferase
MGNVVQAGAKMNPARQAAVHAGLPVTTPALTVNRVCGSGAQAIVSAAQEIWLGNLDVAVAGGMESMDLAPYLVTRGRWGYRMGDGQLYDSLLRDGLNDAFSDAHSGWHTEDLVEKYQVGREAQDRWSVRSQQRFAAAQAAGHFKEQIVPVEAPGKKGPTNFDVDEGNRAETTLDGLARLKPAFRPNGAIAAGNAPGLNDAASAMVLADETWAAKRGLAATARLVSYGIAAVEPGMFGLGPVPAVKQALQRAGWDIRSVERVEINEAFAAIAIVVARELGFSEDLVNIEGGGYRSWSPDRRDWRRADYETHPFATPRRPEARHRHAMHRWGPRHRAGNRSIALKLAAPREANVSKAVVNLNRFVLASWQNSLLYRESAARSNRRNLNVGLKRLFRAVA